jgi:uncharacterized protein DUF3618
MASTPRDGTPAEPDQLRDGIAQNREDLGETVEALARKSDVKTRAQDKADGVKGSAQEKVSSVTETVRNTQVPPAAKKGGVAAAVATAGAGAVTYWMRRRRAKRQTRWQRTLSTAQQGGNKARFLAGAAATAAPVVASRAAQSARNTTPKARTGAGTAVGLGTALWMLRRRKAKRQQQL